MPPSGMILTNMGIIYHARLRPLGEYFGGFVAFVFHPEASKFDFEFLPFHLREFRFFRAFDFEHGRLRFGSFRVFRALFDVHSDPES